MDIHKPKPWHGWREFLKEYGIIVLGVLTALALEQLAGGMKEGHDADEARANIKEELATNLASLSERAPIQLCIDRRLDELRGVVEASSKPGYVRPIWVGRPQHWPMFQAKWNAASNAGRAALLSPKEQADFGQLYYTLAMLQDAENTEQAAWARLRVLTETDRVPESLQGELFTALSQARLTNWQIRLFLVRSKDLAQPLGLPHVMPQHRGSRSVCVPINTPRADALRLSGVPDGIGEP